jgi:uncharacterized LabA/DUF88 family protein
MEKAVVMIDAGFLSKVSYKLGEGHYFKYDLLKFAKMLTGKQKLIFKHLFLYNAPPFQSNPSTKDERARKESYDSFKQKLSQSKEATVREGRCQNINGFREKGVDTLFTIDLMNVLINNFKSKEKIEKVILFTCDTDFVPVIERIKEEGIKIILYYYSDFERKSKFSMSNHILNSCNKKILISKELIKKSEMKK